MHETRATATFAICHRHSICKCCIFFVFYNISNLRCAPDSSHSDISRSWLACFLPCHGLLGLMPMLLAPSAAAEWAKPYGSAAALCALEACEIMFCVILQTAHERPYRGSDIRILRHSVFLVFSSYLCAKCAQDSSPT